MLKYRVTSILLSTSLFFIGLPFGNMATVESSNLRSQEPSLEITETEDGFKGKYKKGNREAFLRMTRKKKVKAKTGNKPNSGKRAKISKASFNARSSAITQELEYYYSDSEIMSSDGSQYAEAVYEFDPGTGLDRLDVTLGGVTMSFDLASQTMLPMSEEDQAKLQQYAQNPDLRLVQDVSIELLKNQAQFTEQDLLFGYVSIAMLVDPADHVPIEEIEETQAKADLPKKETLSGVIAQFISAKLPMSKNGAALRRCSSESKNALVSALNKIDVTEPLIRVSKSGQDCFGCCGYGCNCIRGVPWGGFCAAHDRCVRRYGLVHPICNQIFPFAIGQVLYFLR